MLDYIHCMTTWAPQLSNSWSLQVEYFSVVFYSVDWLDHWTELLYLKRNIVHFRTVISLRTELQLFVEVIEKLR